MNQMLRAPVTTLLCLALVACDGPIILMSGGELQGRSAVTPELWTFSEATGLAQLETRPEDPYSVNIAYVQLDGQLYVYAGDTKTRWVEHIDQNPLVRILIEESIYPVQAIRVTDADELAAFATQWSNRSMMQRDPMQFDEVWLYRLEPRTI